MNTVVLDMLTDPTLRDAETLQAKVVEVTSAGLPWLNEA